MACGEKTQEEIRRKAASLREQCWGGKIRKAVPFPGTRGDKEMVMNSFRTEDQRKLEPISCKSAAGLSGRSWRGKSKSSQETVERAALCPWGTRQGGRDPVPLQRAAGEFRSDPRRASLTSGDHARGCRNQRRGAVLLAHLRCQWCPSHTPVSLPLQCRRMCSTCGRSAGPTAGIPSGVRDCSTSWNCSCKEEHELWTPHVSTSPMGLLTHP